MREAGYLGSPRRSPLDLLSPACNGTVHHGRDKDTAASLSWEVWTMRYVHPEEEFQVWAVEGYEESHPGTRYLVEFADAESYICRFDTAYDSENGGELDIEEDNPLFDEFHQISLEILEVRHPGLRPYDQWLNLDYRDWPIRITDVGTSTVVFAQDDQ